MKRVIAGILFGIFLSVSAWGCAALLIGGGLAGGLAISEDTVRLERDTNLNRAWEVTVKVLEEKGRIELQDKKAGKIEADIRDSKVTVRIDKITASAVRIQIKARKNLFPNIDLATEIINSINSRL